jgi:hypothetical protein
VCGQVGGARTGIEDKRMDIHIAYCEKSHKDAQAHLEMVRSGVPLSVLISPVPYCRLLFKLRGPVLTVVCPILE